MPIMAIYRNNELIWSKEFDPPENGVIELDEPVFFEKGDNFFFKLGLPEIWTNWVVKESGSILKIYCENPAGELVEVPTEADQLWLVDDLGFYSKPDVPPPTNPQPPREGERHVLMGVEYIFLNGGWRRYVEPPDFK